MEDLSILTGGKFITEDLGIKLEKVELSDLGNAKRVTVGQESTTIVEGSGEKSSLEGRVELLREQIAKTGNEYDKMVMKDRLAKTSCKCCSN